MNIQLYILQTVWQRAGQRRTVRDTAVHSFWSKKSKHCEYVHKVNAVLSDVSPQWISSLHMRTDTTVGSPSCSRTETETALQGFYFIFWDAKRKDAISSSNGLLLRKTNNTIAYLNWRTNTLLCKKLQRCCRDRLYPDDRCLFLVISVHSQHKDKRK